MTRDEFYLPFTTGEPDPYPDFTPWPGEPLSQEEHASIRQRFIDVFRIPRHDPIRDPDTPTCAYFGDAAVASWPDLRRKGRNQSLYFYSEQLDVLSEASLADIFRFFRLRPPWQGSDFYIFDESFLWCFSHTHHSTLLLIE